MRSSAARRLGSSARAARARPRSGAACCGWSSPPDGGPSGSLARTSTLLPRAQLRRLRARIQMVFQDPLRQPRPTPAFRRGAIVEPLRLTRSMSCRRLGDLGWGSRSWSTWSASRRALFGALLPPRDERRPASARRHRPGAGATQPDLVVLDEPTSALDVSVRAEILAPSCATCRHGSARPTCSSRTT